MSIRLTNRVLALAVMAATAAFSATAEARVDNGIVPSLYDQSETSVVKPGIGKNFKAKSPKYAKSKKSGRMARARSGGHSSGGGASRSCLTSAARGLLNRIESQFGPVNVISTCRPGAVIATTGKPSKHRHGAAVDFEAGGRKGAIVQWLVANHHSGGTMTYAGMSHIHVDIGYRFVKLGARGHG